MFFDELIGREIIQRTVRSFPIVLLSLFFDVPFLENDAKLDEVNYYRFTFIVSGLFYRRDSSCMSAR